MVDSGELTFAFIYGLTFGGLLDLNASIDPIRFKIDGINILEQSVIV